MGREIYTTSEVFASLEGEGPYTGHPTVYVRLTGCNFTCASFNNPCNTNLDTDEGLGFNPKQYTTLQSLPVITKGCDSRYSWDERFKHLWKQQTLDELVDSILDVLPNRSIKLPSGKSWILSLTGGEPTLRQKQLMPLLNHPSLVDVNKVIIETNCAVPLQEKFLNELEEYSWQNNVEIVWSNSPKLSVSGELPAKAIRPDIAFSQVYNSQGLYRDYYDFQQYFKFVVRPTVEDFEEVKNVMLAYYQEAIPVNLSECGAVYIMPVACTTEQQTEIAKQVADLCMEYGFIYCHRLQNTLYGNQVGT